AWNQVPVKPSFKEWDSLPDVPLNFLGEPLEPKLISLGTKHKATFPVTINVLALSRQYDVYTFADDVGKIEYQNGVAGQPHAGVRALIQLKNGTWKQPQDWTSRDKIDFCRAKPSENVKKLVVITTDSTFDDPNHALQSSSTKLIASSDCLPDTY